MIEHASNDHFVAIVAALAVATILSMIIERLANVLFDDNDVFRDWPRSARRRDNLKSACVIVFSLFLCFSARYDVFAYILPDAQWYATTSDGSREQRSQKIATAKVALVNAEKAHGKGSAEYVLKELDLIVVSKVSASPWGMFLTALLLAGGSSGMMTLFQETLGMSKKARNARGSLGGKASSNVTEGVVAKVPSGQKSGTQKGFSR